MHSSAPNSNMIKPDYLFQLSRKKAETIFFFPLVKRVGWSNWRNNPPSTWTHEIHIHCGMFSKEVFLRASRWSGGNHPSPLQAQAAQGYPLTRHLVHVDWFVKWIWTHTCVKIRFFLYFSWLFKWYIVREWSASKTIITRLFDFFYLLVSLFYIHFDFGFFVAS